MATKKKQPVREDYGAPPATLEGHPFYGFRLDEHQQAFRDAIWNPDVRFVAVDAVAGSGKAQPVDTPIPTPNGNRMLGDLRIGDYVFDRKGKPTRILGVYPQGKQRAFEIEFNDGRTTVCSDKHLWTRYGYYGNFVTEDLAKMLTRTIKNTSRGPRYRIPMNSAVEYDTKPLPIHTYAVGVFLGDGACTCKYLTLSSAEEPIVAEVARLLGCSYKKNSERNYSWSFKKDGHILKTKDIFADIPELQALSCDKKIPEMYMFGDIQQRTELLRGLLDTDGSVRFGENRCNLSFSSTSRHIAYGLIDIVRSLGYTASMHEDRRDKYKAGTCYEVHLRVPNSKKPYIFKKSVKRDVAIQASEIKQQRRYDTLAIKRITDLGYECDMVCIYVDNAEHLYLTNDYIVTHNTTIGIATATLLQAYRVVDSCLYIRTPAAEGRIGFLPGDQKSKERPYMQPLYNTIVKIGEDPMAMIEGNDYESQKYQSAPWRAVTDVYMLGEDFERTAVVIDEAQCMTVDQLKTVITRCHDDCKVIVIGSTLQIQGIAKDKSGFTRCIEHFKDKEWARICTLEKNYRGLMSAWADRM